MFGDSAYGTGEFQQRLDDHRIASGCRTRPPSAPGGMFAKDCFTIDLDADTVTCPGDATVSIRRGGDGDGIAYFAQVCTVCPLLERCTASKTGHTIRVSIHQAALTRARQRQADPTWQCGTVSAPTPSTSSPLPDLSPPRTCWHRPAPAVPCGSHRPRPPVLLAYAMFSRWRQENLFRYLRAHYALDGLDAYAATADDPARLVPNPARPASRPRGGGCGRGLRRPPRQARLRCVYRVATNCAKRTSGTSYGPTDASASRCQPTCESTDRIVSHRLIHSVAAHRSE